MTVFSLNGKAPYYTNCYLLVSEHHPRKAILIDGSVSPTQLTPILQKTEASLQAVLLTHGHFDHVEQLCELQQAFGVPVYLTDADAVLYGVECTRDYAADFVIEEELRPEVLPTPGHTPGSVCLIYPGMAFCGDTLFAGSVGRTDLPGGDAATLFDSLCVLNDVLSKQTGDVSVFSGHGESTLFSLEKSTNPFLLRALR